MIYRFGVYTLDTDSVTLTAEAEPVALEPQVFSLLQFLVEHRGRVVSKNELIEAVWQGRIVSDAALTYAVNAARRAVGDDGKTQGVIRTFPKRGFRFVAEVSNAGSLDLAGSPQEKLILSDKPSIAVLPFDNLSGDPEQEYFSDGITEDIITALGRIRQFPVTARNSTFAYKGRSVDVRTIAKDLGARYVLEGSVRRAGKLVRIVIQLNDGETGNHLWAERYDRALEEIFAVQDEITHSVVAALQPEIARSEIERARRKPPQDLDAWDLYQRGLWHLYRFNETDNHKAIDLFSRAIDIDASFSAAYVGLSVSYFFDLLFGFVARERSDIFAPARKAVELDPDEASTHRALGMAYYINQDLESAIGEFLRSLELNPSNAVTHHFLGRAQMDSGLAELAIASIEKAIALSPRDLLSGHFLAGIAMAHLFLRQYETCVGYARKALQSPYCQWPIRATFAAALGHLGRAHEAKRACADLIAFRSDCSIGFVNRQLGFIDEACRQVLVDGLRKAGLPEG